MSRYRILFTRGHARLYISPLANFPGFFVGTIVAYRKDSHGEIEVWNSAPFAEQGEQQVLDAVEKWLRVVARNFQKIEPDQDLTSWDFSSYGG